MYVDMRKNLLNRVKAIFEVLENKEGIVYKSDFRPIGLDANSSEQWLKIIQYIQSKPKVEVTKAGKFTAVKLTKLDK